MRPNHLLTRGQAEPRWSKLRWLEGVAKGDLAPGGPSCALPCQVTRSPVLHSRAWGTLESGREAHSDTQVTLQGMWPSRQSCTPAGCAWGPYRPLQVPAATHSSGDPRTPAGSAGGQDTAAHMLSKSFIVQCRLFQGAGED